MSDAPIHDLPAATTVAGTDVVPIDQGLVTRKATMTQVSQAVGPINVGVGIHNANAKTTPIDPDELGIVDTADGNTLKKLTWGNLKATLLAYFSALTGTWNISITGNAATSSLAAEATKLQTARNLDVTSFDGTANVTIVAPAIHAATNKATPVDADEAGIWDSVSGLLNKVTWANIKATLKTYFDGIYVALTNLAAAGGSALIGFLQAGIGAVLRTAQSKMRESVSVRDFGATGDGLTDDTAAFQAAVDYVHSLEGGTIEIPAGNYLLGSYVTIYSFIRFIGTAGYATNGTVLFGSNIIINNATSAFLCNGVQRLELHYLNFVAQGTGIGNAYVYMGQTTGFLPPYNYTSVAQFSDLKIDANLKGGFFGNFIMTIWRHCEFGFFGSPGVQFTPIYSLGDVTGNQTNANVIEHCNFVNSSGTDTVYFEAGSNLLIKSCLFQLCNSQWIIRCLGILNVSIEDCYMEACNGASTLYPILFDNDTTSTQNTAGITITGMFASLASNNTHLIRHIGNPGDMVFTGNTVYGVTGKNLVSSTRGLNKGFSLYEGNYLQGLVLTPNAYSLSGNFTPLITGTTGTNVHTYVTQSGHWERRGNIVDVEIYVRISAKDAGSGGYVQITGLSALPAIDTTILATMPEGFAGLVSFYTGVTMSAGLTQLGATIGASNVITFIESGSATLYVQLPMSGIADTTILCIALSYPTSDA